MIAARREGGAFTDPDDDLHALAQDLDIALSNLVGQGSADLVDLAVELTALLGRLARP